MLCSFAVMSKKETLVCVLTYILASLTCTALAGCPFPKTSFENGKLLYQFPKDINLTVAPENYLLRLQCDIGYSMMGRKAIMCFTGAWKPKVPKCIKMKCEDPPTIRNGQYDLKTGVNSRPSIGSSAIYSCDIGYELMNDTASTLICVLDTDTNVVHWSGETPACRAKDSCPDPGLSPDGKREGDCCFTRDVLKYSCKQGYELVGKESIRCLRTGRWTSTRPLCRPLGDHCELPPPILHGAVRGEKAGDYFLPYEEIEVLCEPGFVYKGVTEYVMCEEENGWEIALSHILFQLDHHQPCFRNRLSHFPIEMSLFTRNPFFILKSKLCKGRVIVCDKTSLLVHPNLVYTLSLVYILVLDHDNLLFVCVK